MKTRSDAAHHFLRALNTSVSGNSQAFGFSITITAAFGALSSIGGSPTLPELFGFGLSGVAAFSLLNLIVAGLILDQQGEGEPRRVVLIATATDFLAVGAGIGSAVGVAEAVPGWGGWVLAPFCAGVAYVLIQAVELWSSRQGKQRIGRQPRFGREPVQ